MKIQRILGGVGALAVTGGVMLATVGAASAQTPPIVSSPPEGQTAGMLTVCAKGDWQAQVKLSTLDTSPAISVTSPVTLPNSDCTKTNLLQTDGKTSSFSGDVKAELFCIEDGKSFPVASLNMHDPATLGTIVTGTGKAAINLRAAKGTATEPHTSQDIQTGLFTTTFQDVSMSPTN